jgi:hypothetical protein
MLNGKSGGVDNIPPEVIKAMDNISVKALQHLINRIWNEEQIPDDWRKGLLVKLPKKRDLSLCNNWMMVYTIECFFKIYKIHAERSLPFDCLLYNYSESGNLVYTGTLLSESCLLVS